MERGVFDIYQTRSGYTAVDNETQRRLLQALDLAERQLPELVEITGKSKPTLSATMRDLINRELVSEHPHPTDARRKIYRLLGARIGASDIPVPQLRKAVESYVALTPLAGRVPLATVVAALAAPEGHQAVLAAQARHLGLELGQTLRAADARQLWMRVARWLEDERVARLLRMDLGEGVVGLEPMVEGDAGRLAAVVGGLVDGVFAALQLGGPVVGSAESGQLVLCTEVVQEMGSG